MLLISSRHLPAAGLVLGALALATPMLSAQSPSAELHRGYYLQHEAGDLEGALAVYREVAASQRAPAAVRAKAKAFAQAAAEDLASSDFARLMPSDAMFYLELNRPGEQLDRLAKQLGLLQEDGGTKLGISPRLIRGVLGMRGAAVAITEIDPRRGPTNGVIILHAGDLEVVRGLIESALPAGGQTVEPIHGHPTYNIEDEVFVTLTSRLVIASPDRTQIEAVIGRIDGNGGGSLADNKELAGALAAKSRDDLMFFCLNLEPVMPMLQGLIQHEARRNPEALAALAFLDLESTRYVAGRAGVGDDGISFSMAVELDENHRNLAFNLLRMPNIDAGTLAAIPAGAAFFAAGAINPVGPIPAGATDAEGAPVVTAMDFGREVFGNIADVAFYAMPRVHAAPWGPMPEMALSLRVNDPAQSRAMWHFLLAGAQSATGGARGPQTTESGDATIDRFEIQGVPVLLATQGNNLLVSLSEQAINSSIESRQGGRSILQDPVFANVVADLDAGTSGAVAVNAGRCADIANHFMSDRERREMAPYLGLLRDTSASFGLSQTGNRLAVAGKLTGIPNVGPLVSQLISQQTGRRHRAAAPRPRMPATVSKREALRAEFAKLNDAGNVNAARAVAERIHAAGADDPMFLNTFAWGLLTEPQFGNRYDEQALAISETSNEKSNWTNWYCLDTFATALDRAGQLDRAIAVQRKAVEAASGDPRANEAEQTLQRLLDKAARAKAGAEAGAAEAGAKAGVRADGTRVDS